MKKLLLLLCLLAASGLQARSIKDVLREVSSDGRVLDLHSMRIDSSEGLADVAKKYPNLKQLLLYDNQLKSLSPDIGKLKSLLVLSLDNNQLELLPGNIGELKELKVLHLRSNKLIALPTQITQIKNLRTLLLEHNELRFVPVKGFKDGAKLYIDDNRFKGRINSLLVHNLP